MRVRRVGIGKIWNSVLRKQLGSTLTVLLFSFWYPPPLFSDLILNSPFCFSDIEILELVFDVNFNWFCFHFMIFLWLICRAWLVSCRLAYYGCNVVVQMWFMLGFVLFILAATYILHMEFAFPIAGLLPLVCDAHLTVFGFVIAGLLYA